VSVVGQLRLDGQEELMSVEAQRRLDRHHGEHVDGEERGITVSPASPPPRTLPRRA
jgi:hypothetical protein